MYFKLWILVFCIAFKSTHCELDKETPIVIIGGGLSGISALSRLLENGYKNVVLLEATSRIGGRVFTVLFGENVVDLGAQFVHGQDGNVIYEMVKNENVLGSESNPANAWVISSDGEQPREYFELLLLSFRVSSFIEEGTEQFNSSYGDTFIERY